MLVLGAACLVAAAVGAYARYAILDEQAFADRAVSVLDSGDVQSEAARRLADRAVSEHPELESRRAAIEDAAATAVVRDDAFAPAFRAAATRMQRAIFSDADDACPTDRAGLGRCAKSRPDAAAGGLRPACATVRGPGAARGPRLGLRGRAPCARPDGPHAGPSRSPPGSGSSPSRSS